MKELQLLVFLITTIAFCQNNSEIDISDSKKTLIGEWEFIKTVDLNGNEVKKIPLGIKIPNEKQMTLIAKGPDIIINDDGTYTKIFTPKNSDNGVWRIKSKNEIEYEIIIPKNSRQGRLIQTQKQIKGFKLREDDKGNFLDASSDRIIELRETEMKVEYEKDYLLIYKKVTK